MGSKCFPPARPCGSSPASPGGRGKGEKAAPMRGVRGQPEKGAVPVGHALGGTAGCGIEGCPAVGGPQQDGEAEIPLPPEGGQQLTVSPPLIKGDRSVTEAGIGALAQHLKRTPGFCGRTYAVALEGMVEGGGRPIVQHPDGQEHQNDQTKAQFFSQGSLPLQPPGGIAQDVPGGLVKVLLVADDMVIVAARSKGKPLCVLSNF